MYVRTTYVRTTHVRSTRTTYIRTTHVRSTVRHSLFRGGATIAIANGVAFTTLFDNLNSWNGAAWQQVGPSLLAPGADISGLDFGGTMLLGLATNGANADQLVSFNVSTGAATVIGATGTNAGSVAGLAHAFLGGAWYMTDGSTLFSLDSATGAATQIGAHGVTGFSGLAFVPTPGAAILLGLGGLVVARRRR